MSVQAATPAAFKEEAKAALAKPQLKVALDRATNLLQRRRVEVMAQFPEFQTARDQGAAIKDHTLKYLDHYLEQFEAAAKASGTEVHWASTPEEATRICVEICQRRGAKSATRVKSMLGEEIGLPKALTDAGIERVETDLAEHIIQLADERPSHIVIPALHKTQEEVADLFTENHAEPRASDDVEDLVASARHELRDKYVSADVGISGANFLIAETGAIVTVTNEGNAELTTALPPCHIVTVGIEKLVPNQEHASVFLRLLARSALGSEFTQYVTFYNGPKRLGDHDGPEEMHIVLVDNRRTQMLAGDMRKMLRCIRCGACMNHCPVYGAVGGHPYGGTYPGPMGSVLTPALTSLEEAGDLPNACTLNGRCQEVCPVKIPLTDMMRSMRERQWRERMVTPRARLAIQAWAFAAKRPWLYRAGTRVAVKAMRLFRGKRGRIQSLPLAGGWTGSRDMTAPERSTFMAQWKAGRRC
jgi:L-lactate dehydrogenase complex protein LldF